MKPKNLSRRTFLAIAGVATTGIGAGHSARAAESGPKETGLSWEGLLAGLPGFQPRTIAPLPREELAGFLSKAQLAMHHADYVKSVEALKSLERSLDAADRSTAALATYGDLRRKQVAAANSMILHELYFRNLAQEKVDPPRYLRSHMSEHMGSLESWASDFAACALAAKAWAALVYDPYDDRWHNAVMDGDAEGVWIGANPLVVCDVAEHAYRTDYEKKEDYVAKFIERIDWNEVAARYKKVDRM